MTAPSRARVEGPFVVVRVGALRVAVDAGEVTEVSPRGEAENAVALETVLGLDGPTGGDRVELRLRRDGRVAALDVPGLDLEVGRRLNGRCQVPALVAGALERSCLAGVVEHHEEFFLVFDVARFWTRVVAPVSPKGETS